MVRLKLKKLLDERGLSQHELARRTGIRQPTISEMSRNSRDAINRKHLATIMKALNIMDFNEILELSDK